MTPSTRRELRAEAVRRTESSGDEAVSRRRPVYRRAWFWVVAAVLVVLIALGIAAAVLLTAIGERARAAEGALYQVEPLAALAKDQVLAGDTVGAAATVDALRGFTAQARAETEDPLWEFGERLPVIGPNLVAGRTVAVAVDDLVVDAVVPAIGVDVGTLRPVDGRIDPAALEDITTRVDGLAVSVSATRATLSEIDTSGLLGQVTEGIVKLDTALGSVEPMLTPAQETLSILPALLGMDGPRNYLVLVQNNAELRGTGGNPAALVMLAVEDGAISITRQASSLDFANGRPSSIVELGEGTEQLYGDKVGRYMQDVTTTPDFTESARIMGAFWQESFGTRIDGTVSIDPVALSYLMVATGPVTLPNGDVLASDTVVSKLLNEVYFRYEDPEEQDAYFAQAAAAVFAALTSTQDVRALVGQIAYAVEDGRILYAPGETATSVQEAAMIAGTRLEGRLPADNADRTVVASYINDITEGKLDYYLSTALAVHSDLCMPSGAEAAPTFTVETTLTSLLRPDEVDGLAVYISPARFFPKGVISSDVVVYGPVGASFVSVAVDGVAVAPSAVVTHLGRPAVKVNVRNDPASTHIVTAMFTGVAGETYGPIEAWHTPTVWETPVVLDTPECTALAD